MNVVKKNNPTVTSAWIYLAVSLFITIIKFAAFAMTHSQAVFSDALESIVNVLAAIVAVVVMRFVAEPADKEHPYGHGKLEYFSSAFEGGVITFAALAIAYEAIGALIQGPVVHEIQTGVILVAIGALFNLFLSFHLRSVGKKNNSAALIASSTHVMSDVITTVGVIVGLVLIKMTDWLWIDPVVALIVALQLGVSGYKIVRQSAGGLIDEVDKKSIQNLVEALNLHKRPGLINVHNVRIIRAGKFHHVDAHLVVPDFWNALEVHNESHDFEKKVVATYPHEGEFAFHIDPCQREYCSVCDLLNCPIRQRPFDHLVKFTTESLISGPMKDIHD